MKRILTFVLIASSILLSQSCTKCKALVFCPSKNQVIDKVVGNDLISLYVPNTFTPNGDAANDYFGCFGKNIASFECKIYHKDNLVYTLTSLVDSNYEAHLPNEMWDGKVNGEILVTVYSLKVNATTVTGETISFNGTLSAVCGELLGDNSLSVEGERHAIVKYENAQTPMQNNNGVYDPNMPTFDYFSGPTEIHKCI